MNSDSDQPVNNAHVGQTTLNNSLYVWCCVTTGVFKTHKLADSVNPITRRDSLLIPFGRWQYGKNSNFIRWHKSFAGCWNGILGSAIINPLKIKKDVVLISTTVQISGPICQVKQSRLKGQQKAVHFVSVKGSYSKLSWHILLLTVFIAKSLSFLFLFLKN